MLKCHIQNNCFQNMNPVSFVDVTHNYYHLKLRVYSHNVHLIFLVLAEFWLLIWFLQSLHLYDDKN